MGGKRVAKFVRIQMAIQPLSNAPAFQAHLNRARGHAIPQLTDKQRVVFWVK